MKRNILSIVIPLIVLYVVYLYGSNYYKYKTAKNLISACEARTVLTGHSRNIVTLKNDQVILINTMLPFANFSFPTGNVPRIQGNELVFGDQCTPMYSIQ